MSAGSGKKGPPDGASPPNLLEPESFWSSDGEVNLDADDLEEETTQPVLVTPPRMVNGLQDDDDIATVGFDEFNPSATGSGLRRTEPTAAKSRKMPIKPVASFNPVMNQSRDVPGDQPVVFVEQSMELKKALLYLGLVALVFGFLGWFLVGRHSAQPSVAVQDEHMADTQQSVDDNEIPPEKKEARFEPGALELADTPSLTGDGPPGVRKHDVVLDEKVFIEVISNPPGAEVFVDGAKTGVAPTSIKGVKSRGLRLRLFLAGYEPWERVLDFSQKVPKQLSIALVKKHKCLKGTGFLSVSSSPSGAKIELDGDEVPDKTPTVINDVCARQPLHLTIKRPRYRPWKKTVTVNKGDILSVKAKLQKASL